jgi:hypothetical protein
MEDSENKKINIQEPDIVFSKAIQAGKRIYYIDVKKNRKEELFLTITESKKISDKSLSPAPIYYEKHKIFIYKEDYNSVLAALSEAIAFAQDNDVNSFR